MTHSSSSPVNSMHHFTRRHGVDDATRLERSIERLDRELAELERREQRLRRGTEANVVAGLFPVLCLQLVLGGTLVALGRFASPRVGDDMAMLGLYAVLFGLVASPVAFIVARLRHDDRGMGYAAVPMLLASCLVHGLFWVARG